MDYFCPLSEKEFSQKKLEAYDRFGKVINEGRKNPIWFVEYMYGLKLIDYQAYGFMKYSSGCVNCYAEMMARRLKAMGIKKYENKVCWRKFWRG